MRLPEMVSEFPELRVQAILREWTTAGEMLAGDRCSWV